MRARQSRVVFSEDVAGRKEAAKLPRCLTVALRRGDRVNLSCTRHLSCRCRPPCSVYCEGLQKPRLHHGRGFVFLDGDSYSRESPTWGRPQSGLPRRRQIFEAAFGRGDRNRYQTAIGSIIAARHQDAVDLSGLCVVKPRQVGDAGLRDSPIAGRFLGADGWWEPTSCYPADQQADRTQQRRHCRFHHHFSSPLLLLSPPCGEADPAAKPALEVSGTGFGPIREKTASVGLTRPD